MVTSGLIVILDYGERTDNLIAVRPVWVLILTETMQMDGEEVVLTPVPVEKLIEEQHGFLHQKLPPKVLTSTIMLDLGRLM
jgi:hypothetical protein